MWVKSKSTNFLNAKKQPLRKHEDVCVFYAKQPTYNPQMTEGDPYDKGIRKNQLSGSYGDFQPRHVKSDGKRYPHDILEIELNSSPFDAPLAEASDDANLNEVLYYKTAESEGEVFHPTQKPIDLGRYLIRTYTNEGDIVLDNTCGSGSFLVAAALEKRDYIGIELNENAQLHKKGTVDYVEISKKRIAQALQSHQFTLALG